MYDVLLQLAVKLNKTRRKKQWWHRAVSAMAMTVIFCTTYALILPAITMQKDAVCGLEEHLHSELCYEQYRFECDLASFDKVLHKHDELCYNAEGALICPMQQLEEHIHGDECYQTEQLLVCEFAHTHDENCEFIGEGKLVCAIPESEGHTHDQSCITYKEELTCELQEGDVHTHSDSCYIEETVPCGIAESEGHTHDDQCGSYQDVLTCEKQEQEAHTHSDSCYTETEQPCEKQHEEGHECDENCVATAKELTCDIEETEGHSHDESCYQQQYIPCNLPETEGHTHSESCTTVNKVLDCAVEENVSHTHGEQCYTRIEIPCEIAESEGHTHSQSCYDFSDAECSITAEIEHEHSESCYQQQKTLVCELQEIICHTHDQSCKTEDGQTVICEKPQIAWHQHTDSCIKSVSVGEAKLICQLNEHVHINDCYSLKGGKIEPLQFICGLGVHSHVQNCYDEQQNLICTIPEHHHTAECVVENIDLTAGVETREEWNEMIAQLPLTGHWPSDIVAIAQSQQGYAEHSRNVVLTNDGVLNGYTRYGDWFGDKYADWNAPFASFVLSYAGVTDYPVLESGAAQWKFDLEQAESFALPADYTPKAGDLVFVKDTGEQEAPVVEYYPIETEPADKPEDETAEQPSVEETEPTDKPEDETAEQPSVEETEPTDKPEDETAEQPSVEETEPSDKPEDETDERPVGLEPTTEDQSAAPEQEEEYQQSVAGISVEIIKVEKDPEKIDYDSDSFEGEIPSTVVMTGKGMEEKILGENPIRSIPAPKTLEQPEQETEQQPAEPEETEYLVAIVTGLRHDADGKLTHILTTQGDFDNEVAELTYSIDDENIAGYAVIPEGDVRILTYQGEDYTVTVRFGSDAQIPDTAALDVREIMPDTDEYTDYYTQSVETLLGTEVSEEQIAEAVSSARFFDVTFVDGGTVIEPSAMVQVQISYSEAINKAENEQGVALHFAETGLEVMAAETSQTTELRQDHIDTFAFEQDSFSVVGVMMLNMNRAIGVTSATPINFNQLEAGGDIYYVIYTQYNGQYYALTSKTGDVTGYSVPITMNADGTISWDTVDESIFWTFQNNGGNSYYVQNYSSLRYIHAFDNSSGTRVDYGTLTGGRNPSTLTASGTGFIAQGNRYYTRLNNNNGTITFTRGTQQSNSATTFYIAQVGRFHNIWFDGTNGGLMQLYGSDDINFPVAKVPGVDTITVELPETWKSPTKYPYRLKGWYDINACKYYPVDPNDDVVVTAQVTGDTVFYADWVAASYDIGFNNEHVVPTVDNSEFVTTYVFDYSALFNLLSAKHTGTISSASHTETWSMLTNGEISPHSGEKSLNFAFVDYDGGGDISYANNRQTHNNSQSGITAGILEDVAEISDQDLLKLLFDPEVEIIGKEYVGKGNYLFHYVELNGEDEDAIYNGFYSFDAREHAAAYNQTEQRFYLYDYLERSSDTRKDAGGSSNQYSDFLPFNSPYIFNEDQIDVYQSSDGTTGYEYDSKGGNSYPEYNSADDAMVNYMFGLRSDADFYLAYPSGSKDQFDNYLNTTTSGEHLIFEFHGDDDLWVFVDGELLLDVGGIHGVMYGEINFSTGTVLSGKEGGTVTTKTFEQILGHQLDEGAHVMSIYYLERGGSQANCTIYFNVVPRYTLNVIKEDIFTLKLLDGAKFSIYTEEACGINDRAQLWDSKADYHADMDDGVADEAKYEFEVVDGMMTCWGLAAGKTYYMKETTAPEGYPYGDDIIRITLNDRGSSEIETTTLVGPDEQPMEGFGIVEQMVDDKLQQITLTLTNQKHEETTKLRVKKVWDGEALELPPSVTMQLMVDGQPVGRTAILTDEEGWVYTWTGLPKYEDDGETEINYEVRETQVPGFETEPPTYKYNVAESIEWTRTGKMQDRNTYLLVNSGRALSYNSGDGFSWMSISEAEDLDTGSDAQWEVTTNEHGFRLTNRSGYIITYSNDSGNGAFFGGQSAESDINQIIYYVDNRLLIHDHDQYLQFSVDGEAVEEDGIIFSLYRLDTITGTVAEVFNKLLPNEDRTFMQVNKVWDDGEDPRDHSEDQVTVVLYADGVSTGRSVILSPLNSWTARFDGLPYYAEDNVTPIQYTAIERVPQNYEAEYTTGTLPGETVVTWKRATDFSQSGDYRITSGSHALSIASNGTVTVAQNSDDASLYWEIVKSGSSTYLKHKNTGRYLRIYRNALSTITRQSSATAVTMEGDAIKIGNYYLVMSANSVSITSYSFNSTYFTVSVRTEGTGKSGISVTVTNRLNETYQLPDTGGGGTTPYYAIGGLLVTAAVSIYICKFGRKRRIEGG